MSTKGDEEACVICEVSVNFLRYISTHNVENFNKDDIKKVKDVLRIMFECCGQKDLAGMAELTTGVFENLTENILNKKGLCFHDYPLLYELACCQTPNLDSTTIKLFLTE